MADTSSKHNILVTDNGSLKNVNKSATELKNTLDAAGTAAERTAAKVKKASAPTPVAAARAARDMGGQASEDSGTARGIGGLTGAAGRDFAKQSQGLGGLVRLYATFAANIFAATAAFGALSRAMDTTNMVQGLNQLGAASGKNLGTLAKQVFMATEGAISMREAMETVSKASSAGMSNKQILAMTDSAKKASQALGVNMTDAVSRLTRGISKLEPELLDELGIFTKVDKATQDYAKSVGKTTAAITDYEKRQAYANAVLAEAKQKFSEIDIPSNPYSKLLASFQNLAQSGLELANKVLAPVLRMLSESPTALAVAMAYIGTLILRTAIPALGAWREGLRKAADQAAATSEAFNKSFGDAFQEKMEARFRIPIIDKDIEKNTAAIAKARKQLDALVRPTSLTAPSISKLLTSEDVTSKAVEAIASRKRKQLKDDLDGTAKLKADKKIAVEEELAYLEKVKAKKQEIARLQATGGSLARQKNTAVNSIEDAVNNITSKVYDTERIAELRAQKLAVAAQKSRLISNAAETTSIIGVKHALANLHQELTDNGIKGWAKWSTMGKGAVVSVFTRISGIASAFGQIGMMVAATGLAMQVLDSIFSNNTKEMERTAQALETVEAALENVGSTVDHISKKPFLEQISTASIMARTNALGELTDSIGTLASAMDKEIKTSGIYEKITQGFLSLFRRDDITKSAKKTALAINEAFKLALPSKTKSNAEADMIKLLGVSPSDINGMITRLSEDFVTLGTKSEKIVDKLVADMRKVSGAATQLDESFITAGKSYDAVVNSAMPTDHLAKLGMDTVAMANNMAEAFKSPVTAMNQLVKIADDMSKLRFLDPKTAEQLFNMGPAISKGVEKVQELNTVLEKADQAQKEIDSKRKELEQQYGKAGAKFNNAFKASGLENRQAGVSAIRDNAQKSMQEAEATILPMMKNLKKIQDESFAKGADLVRNSIAIGFREAAITVQKAWASTLPGDTSGAISENARIEQASLSIQADQVRASLGLIDSMTKLTLVQEKANIMKEREELNKDPKNSEFKQFRLNQLAIREAAVDGLRERGDISRYTGRQAVPNITTDLNGSGPVQQAQAQLMMGSVFQRNAKEAEIAKLNAQQTAIKIKEQADLLSLTYTRKKEQLTLDVSGLNVQKSLNELQTYGAEYLTEAQLYAKQELDRKIELKNNSKEQLDIENKLAQLQVTLNKGTGDMANTKKSIAETEARQRNLTQTQADALKISEDNRTRDALANAKNIFNVEQAIAKIKEDSASVGQANIIAVQEERLSILSSIEAVSAEYIANQNTSIALSKEELRSTEAIRAARDTIKEAKFNRSQLGPEASTTKYDEQIRASQQVIANEQQLSQVKLANINLQGKFNEALAQQNALMSTMVDITTTLSNLFGEAGNTMGKALETIAATAIEYSKAQERNVVLQERMFELQNSEGVGNEKEKLKLQKEITKSETSSYIAVSKGIASVAGAAKNMFKERSAGYKLLSAVEKAAHVATLAMQAKELAGMIASIAPNIAGGVSKLIAQSGWLGFAGAAAFLALMASLGYGGGKASVPSGFDAESQQKVQGTGQMYQDGQLVNRGGGALGDNTAKANSLNNAIDKIEEHSFSTMEYSNDMLDNLKSIKKNTEGLSAMILQSGLNTRGLDVNGEVVTGIGPRKTDMMTKIGDILSGSQLLKDLGLGNTGIGKFLDKLNTSIWGGKTKTEILDLGITFAGSINSLVKSLEEGGKGLNAIYQNVKTTVSGGWFRSDKTNITTQFQELEAIQAEAFGSIFKSIGDTVASAAEALGKDPKITTSIMDSFEVVFKTSFEGLKPEEVTGALEAEFSNTFNQLAEKVLPEFQKFRKPGEEFGDTIVRLARDVQVSALVLEASGMAIGSVAKALKQGESIQEATVRITESLIDLSGGLEKFVSQGQFFNENFLTEAERLAPVQARVTKELSRLQSVADKSGVSIKIAGINTREGFANVVRGLDLAQTSNQELYAGLMNLAEGFAEVYEETRNTSNILKDLKKANLDLQDQYDKLTMSEFDYIDKVTKSYTDEEKLQYRQNLALEYTIKALKMDIDYRNMEVDLLRAQGKETESLALAREIEMRGMSRSEQIVQRLINARKDEIRIAQEATNISQKYANLEVELLRAQGKGTEALKLSRERELAIIDPANRALQESVYAREDEIKLLQEATNINQKYANLEVELLRAQGKESEALVLSRKIELDTIDPANRALQESVYAREDEIKLLQEANGIKQKYADLEIELLRAQGKETEAIALSRERELATIDPANRALQESVYAREDEIAAIESQKRIRQLEIDGLSALGFTYEALIRSRDMELSGLNEAEKKLKQYVFAAEDRMATDNLQIDLMEAMGDISGATTARRRLELRGMSAVDQQLKIRIWRLQDEKELLAKHNEQQVTILELLGRSSEALALSRQLELETMDAQLRPAQEYIWALQDEQKLKDELQEAYDKQKDTLKSTVSTLRDASRALKDYRAELLQSELSVLNPQQKYAEAKQQALNLAAIATSVATTETQRLEKEAAISKLPGATNAWLEASRTLYASSQAYTNDFNTALSILDQTSAALDAQQSDAEKQLSQLEASNGYLSELRDSSRSIEVILKDLATATAAVAAAQAAVPAVTPTASSPFAVATTGASGSLQDASWVGSKGLKTTSKEIAATINSMVNSDPYGLYNKYVSEGFSSQMVDSIMGYAPGTALDWAKTLGLPAFAKGGLASGVAMVGEYGREVVDFQNPGRVYSANNTSMMMGNTQELVSEIRALRAEVAKLREEQREQTGDLIKSNYDANGMTADTVKAANDANANNWKERNQFKLA